MIPQISGGITQQLVFVPFPSRTFKFTTEKTAGFVDREDAIKQAVFHILSTERYAYIIYDENYGVQLRQYKGQSFSFLEATIQNTLRDALLQDDRILGVTVTNIAKLSENSALVEFTVTHNKGTFGTEVEVNVG